MKLRSGAVIGQEGASGGASAKKAKTGNVASLPDEQDFTALNAVARAEKKAECSAAVRSLWSRTEVRAESTERLPDEQDFTALNAVARAEKKAECSAAVRSLWVRTEVRSESTEHLDDLIMQISDELGIVIDKANTVCYCVYAAGEEEDYGASVGGFSAMEKKKVYKLPPSQLDPVLLRERRLPRIGTTLPALTVVCNSHGNICFIHLQNVLTNYQLQQRNHIKNVFFGKMLEGWCKSCGLSGFINLPHILSTLRANSAAQKAYFGRYFEEYTVQNVVPTYNGKGGTAKTLYVNRKEEEKTFQVGNHINRVIIPGHDKAIEKNNYVDDMRKVLAACDPFIEYPSPEPHTPGFPLCMDVNHCTKKDYSVAVNFRMHGQEAPHCIHFDKTVYGPCAATAMKDPKHKGSLSSLHHHFNADAGELFHEIGGLVHGYNHRDIVIFNGKHYHSPMATHPLVEGEKAGRLSFVVFRNKPKK